ncbi:AAEL007249-PA [Aedes aegypti]|uniref:AAEL007249-PA n=1 Tax=Aedes aegypti TaxID=7159 RepID=Q172V9_AEDAE|nr:AAEL007249-PA [Aedes aegypti]
MHRQLIVTHPLCIATLSQEPDVRISGQEATNGDDDVLQQSLSSHSTKQSIPPGRTGEPNDESCERAFSAAAVLAHMSC